MNSSMSMQYMELSRELCISALKNKIFIFEFLDKTEK